MYKKPEIRGISILICLVLVLSACNLPKSNDVPEGQINITQAYQTVEARLTQAALLTPTSAPTATQTPAPSPTQAPPSQTAAPTKPAPTQPAVTGCDQAAPGTPNIDVTIPDDTKMLPGQTFTKTWRLQNSGTCTWTTAYTIAFFSGESMGAVASAPLPKNVAPGESVDIH